MSVCAEEPCPPVATDIDVLSDADHNEYTVDTWILVHLHCWMIYVLLIPLQVWVPFAVAACNQLALFLLSSSPDEWADSTVLADWQFCESWDHVFSVMNHVAPVKANLNTINVELSASVVVNAPSFSNHATHSRVCYSSSSADLLSTSDFIIEKQDVVDPP